MRSQKLAPILSLHSRVAEVANLLLR